jgi:hypothetical protein
VNRLPTRGPFSGPNALALKAWVAEHMPKLDAELAGRWKDQVRQHLNQVTGCNVPQAGRIEDGCAVFLAALKKMKETT